MPNKIHSEKQKNFFQGIAHGMKPKKGKHGPSPKVAKEILSKEKK